MLRDNAATRFKFGPTAFRLIPNNPDGSVNSPSRVVSDGPGPWDFTDAAVDAAVTLTLKLDNGAVVNETLDLSAFTITAITAANLAAAFTAATVSGYTGTVEAGTGYFLIQKTTPGSARYLQVGGEIADLTGMRATIITSDNQKTIAVEYVNKDSETISTIDSNGKETAVITDGYPTAATITLTDATFDQAIKVMIEGGTLVTDGFTAKKYKSPGADSVKPEFTVETINSMYAKDTNQATNEAAYVWRRYKSCKGMVGGEAGDRNFQDQVYTITAVPYRDPVTSVKDTEVYSEQALTVAEYESLNFTSL